jgi:hypothetical protein
MRFQTIVLIIFISFRSRHFPDECHTSLQPPVFVDERKNHWSSWILLSEIPYSLVMLLDDGAITTEVLEGCR